MTSRIPNKDSVQPMADAISSAEPRSSGSLAAAQYGAVTSRRRRETTRYTEARLTAQAFMGRRT